MSLIECLFCQVNIEILLCGNSIGQTCQVLEVSSRNLYLTVMLVHGEESVHLLIDNFHDMIRDSFPLEVFQECLRLFLFLIFLIREVLF